jgi:branched-subunit amino acid ABC-type transport system permease component
MKSKEEVHRLLWALGGALAGVALGFGLMTMVFARLQNASPGIMLLCVMLFCGGGLVGGGYVALWLIGRKQKIVRKQYFDSKKKRRKSKK